MANDIEELVTRYLDVDPSKSRKMVYGEVLLFLRFLDMYNNDDGTLNPKVLEEAAYITKLDPQKLIEIYEKSE